MMMMMMMMIMMTNHDKYDHGTETTKTKQKYDQNKQLVVLGLFSAHFKGWNGPPYAGFLYVLFAAHRSEVYFVFLSFLSICWVVEVIALISR